MKQHCSSDIQALQHEVMHSSIAAAVKYIVRAVVVTEGRTLYEHTNVNTHYFDAVLSVNQ
jgi:hypothetical protein